MKLSALFLTAVAAKSDHYQDVFNKDHEAFQHHRHGPHEYHTKEHALGNIADDQKEKGHNVMGTNTHKKLSYEVYSEHTFHSSSSTKGVTGVKVKVQLYI